MEKDNLLEQLSEGFNQSNEQISLERQIISDQNIRNNDLCYNSQINVNYIGCAVINQVCEQSASHAVDIQARRETQHHVTVIHGEFVNNHSEWPSLRVLMITLSWIIHRTPIAGRYCV